MTIMIVFHNDYDLAGCLKETDRGSFHTHLVQLVKILVKTMSY